MVSEYYPPEIPLTIFITEENDWLKPFIPFQSNENPRPMLKARLLIHTGKQAILQCVTGILPLPSEMLFHSSGDVKLKHKWYCSNSVAWRKHKSMALREAGDVMTLDWSRWLKEMDQKFNLWNHSLILI